MAHQSICYNEIVARLKFPPGYQHVWLMESLHKTNLSYSNFAKLSGFNSRTFNDWLREKYTLPEWASEIISAKTGIKLPSNITKLEDFWNNPYSAKVGAKKRMQLYGPPGTPAGRKKGGHISQQRRLEHPENYQNCNIRKEYKWPKKSKILAELIGIILGDGGITHDQLKITLNYFEEKDYIRYVSNLVKKLFGEEPALYTYKNKNVKVCNLALSGVKIVEFLILLGLKRGNKVEQQIQMPDWIKANPDYSVAALKGLVDTDGGVFYHRHKNKFGSYFNLGLTFTSHSMPLLDFVCDVLIKNSFSAKKQGDGIYLYRLGEVIKYQGIIGFGNKHHKERIAAFLQEKLKWKGAGAV